MSTPTRSPSMNRRARDTTISVGGKDPTRESCIESISKEDSIQVWKQHILYLAVSGLPTISSFLFVVFYIRLENGGQIVRSDIAAADHVVRVMHLPARLFFLSAAFVSTARRFSMFERCLSVLQPSAIRLSTVITVLLTILSYFTPFNLVNKFFNFVTLPCSFGSVGMSLMLSVSLGRRCQELSQQKSDTDQTDHSKMSLKGEASDFLLASRNALLPFSAVAVLLLSTLITVGAVWLSAKFGSMLIAHLVILSAVSFMCLLVVVLVSGVGSGNLLPAWCPASVVAMVMFRVALTDVTHPFAVSFLSLSVTTWSFVDCTACLGLLAVALLWNDSADFTWGKNFISTGYGGPASGASGSQPSQTETSVIEGSPANGYNSSMIYCLLFFYVSYSSHNLVPQSDNVHSIGCLIAIPLFTVLVVIRLCQPSGTSWDIRDVFAMERNSFYDSLLLEQFSLNKIIAALGPILVMSSSFAISTRSWFDWLLRNPIGRLLFDPSSRCFNYLPAFILRSAFAGALTGLTSAVMETLDLAAQCSSHSLWITPSFRLFIFFSWVTFTADLCFTNLGAVVAVACPLGVLVYGLVEFFVFVDGFRAQFIGITAETSKRTYLMIKIWLPFSLLLSFSVFMTLLLAVVSMGHCIHGTIYIGTQMSLFVIGICVSGLDLKKQAVNSFVSLYCAYTAWVEALSVDEGTCFLSAGLSQWTTRTAAIFLKVTILFFSALNLFTFYSRSAHWSTFAIKTCSDARETTARLLGRRIPTGRATDASNRDNSGHQVLTLLRLVVELLTYARLAVELLEGASADMDTADHELLQSQRNIYRMVTSCLCPLLYIVHKMTRVVHH